MSQTSMNPNDFDAVAKEAEDLVQSAPKPPAAPAGTRSAPQPDRGANAIRCAADAAKAQDQNALAMSAADILQAKANGLFSGWDWDKILDLLLKILPLLR